MLRYADIVPAEFYCLDPLSFNFKKCLKDWVFSNISKDGDYIFQGKVYPPENRDGLSAELNAWKERELLDWKSLDKMEMFPE